MDNLLTALEISRGDGNDGDGNAGQSEESRASRGRRARDRGVVAAGGGCGTSPDHVGPGAPRAPRRPRGSRSRRAPRARLRCDWTAPGRAVARDGDLPVARGGPPRLQRVGTDAARATYAWTIDLERPPRPVLTEAPDELSAATTGPLRVPDAEPGVTLQCRLDDGPARPCASPRPRGARRRRASLRGRRARCRGQHQRGGDARLDGRHAAAPSAADHRGAGDADAATGARFALAGREPGARLRCRLDGAPASCDGADGLAEGDHVFAATAVDAAGNESAPADVSLDDRRDAHRAAPSITARPRDRTPRATATFAFTGASGSSAGSTTLRRCPARARMHLPDRSRAGAHTFVGARP